MNIKDFNNKILIIKDGAKNSILNLINREKKLLNIKIITLSELKRNYYFDYDKETIYYVSKKYNVNGDIAKIYLNNLYYVKDLNDEKIIFLNELKRDLDNNGLLKYNELFKDFLTNKYIVLYNLNNIDKFYLNIFDEIIKNNHVEFINNDIKDNKKDLYECSNIEEEVSFVASKICELIKSGININNIKISNINDSYYYIVKKIFRLFNIPINLRSNTSIKGSNIVKCFKNNYSSNISETLNKVKELVFDEYDNDLYKQLINIVNNYSFIKDFSDVKELIFNDIDNIKIQNKKLKNAVNIIDIESEIVSDDEYVFLLNFNEGVIPINYKDEDYLSDNIKDKLNISTSIDLNYKANNNLKICISNIKNIIVTYSKHDLSTELYISSSYDENLFDRKDAFISFKNSNSYNKLKLLSKKDEYNKFGTIDDEFRILNSLYKNEKYMDYSNKYTLINKDKLYEYLNKKLSLSYSSLNTYYECGFKYYLDYVLKVNKFEDSFDTVIGSLFHKILSICFNVGFDFESSWNNEINNIEYELKESEKFFLNKLKDELILIIETIKNQLKYTSLTKSMYEKEIIIDINKDLNISFKGFVDKILYDEFNGKTVVAIIDYKTGSPVLNINNSYYGLDMQLPIYMYLIKNKIKDVKIGGFYLQKIISNEKNIDDRINSLKLQGYSNSDEGILKLVDSSYMDSNIIKSLKVGTNGFYSYSKVISDEEIDKLYEIVNDKIMEASENILSSKFDINPKRIKDTNKGCMYCKYNDICYKREEDIVDLEEVKNIFGGENNE